MSASPPPKGGVVLLYENVKVIVSDGLIEVRVTLANGAESTTVINQKDGQVVGRSHKPA